jgi:hypothetical protein
LAVDGVVVDLELTLVGVAHAEVVEAVGEDPQARAVLAVALPGGAEAAVGNKGDAREHWSLVV